MKFTALRHAGGAAPKAEIHIAQSVSPDATRRSASKRQGSWIGAPAPNPVRIGKPVIHPQAASTPAPLSGAASGKRREARRLVEIAHEAVEHLDLERARDSRPSRPPRRSARLSRSRRARRARAKGTGACATGRPFTRARSAARLAASVAPSPAATSSISPLEARKSRVRLRRQPDDATRHVHAFRPCGRPQQPFDKTRPGFQQPVADQQHDIRAHARFAGRREHDAGFAHAVEIAHQRRRMHMLDNAADPFGERDRRPRSFDIGAQSRDERLTALRQEFEPLQRPRRRATRALRQSMPRLRRRLDLSATFAPPGWPRVSQRSMPAIAGDARNSENWTGQIDSPQVQSHCDRLQPSGKQ